MNPSESREESGKTRSTTPDNSCFMSKPFSSKPQFYLEHGRIFIEAPEVANLLGMYPKTDNSHGFAFYQTYEMYRDFQENTPNSDVTSSIKLTLSLIFCAGLVRNVVCHYRRTLFRPLLVHLRLALLLDVRFPSKVIYGP